MLCLVRSSPKNVHFVIGYTPFSNLLNFFFSSAEHKDILSRKKIIQLGPKQHLILLDKKSVISKYVLLCSIFEILFHFYWYMLLT